MAEVAFVFTNPRHHLEMMAPVADELAARGVACALVSLAELRGHDTPAGDPRIRRAIPVNLRRRPAAAAATGASRGTERPDTGPNAADAAGRPAERPDTGPNAADAAGRPAERPDTGPNATDAASRPAERLDTGPNAAGAAGRPAERPGSGHSAPRSTERPGSGSLHDRTRRAAAQVLAALRGRLDRLAAGPLAQRVVWRLALAPRLRRLLRDARVVVVPNDAVFPYIALLAQCRARGQASVLMQEGIRFALPDGYAGPTYGGGGTAAVCAWGEGSADHFAACRIPREAIRITGAPRLDTLDPAAWRSAAAELTAELALAAPPIAFLSNPIEIQGYGTRDDKLALFARFLAGAAPVVRPRGIPILVKCHLHEDPGDYRRIADASPIPELVHIARGGSIFAAIAAARAAVVLTSTVGLEALAFGLPLGVLEIPGHPFAFEYVQRGAAVPLHLASITEGITELLADPPARRAAGRAFVDRHLHDRGRARRNVADVIQQVLAQGTS